MSSPYPLDAGVTLRATEALAGQELWTREQVAYVIACAYWSGAGVIGRHDAAELAEFAYAATLGHDWLTPGQRVRRRIETMERADEFVKLRRRATWPAVRPGPITGVDENGYVVQLGVCDPDVEWPEVAVPGGGGA